MSRSAVDHEKLEKKQDTTWRLKIPENIPHIFDLARYAPPKSCRINHARIWSRFVRRVSGQAQEQQDQIPLTSVDLTLQPDAASEYSGCTLSHYSSVTSKASSRKPGSLVFNIDFGDERFVKEVDFATFSRWENVKTLLESFEDEGAIINELWDIREQMPIWSGDWEARVYPGMEIDARCRRPWDEDFDCNSDDADHESLEDVMWQTNKRARHWWFGRWRMKVEQETMGIGAAGREPSRRTVLLGVVAMAAFLGVVIVLCAL